MRVQLSKAADADLADILAYSIERYGRAAAEEYLKGIDRALALAAQHPRAGPVHPDLDPPIRSLPHRRHRLYYQVESDHILVVRVLHNAMDALRSLGG